MSEINYDDPGTWPEDLDGLEALANGQAPEAGEEQDAGPEPEAKPDGPEPEAEPAETAVLAKDGKHLIPYSVVEELRETNKQLSRALELANQAKPGTEEPPPDDKGKAELPIWLQPKEAQEAYLDDLRFEMGDKAAEQEQRIWEVERKLYERELKDWQAQQQTRQAKANDLQAAIDGHPLMSAWQADEASDWYAKADTVFKSLSAHDAAFAKLPLADQIAQVAERTEALFGESPHRAALKPAKPQTKKAELSSKFPARVPTSMSELPGGSPPALDRADQYETMSGAALTNHFNSLSQKQLAQALADLGI